MEVSTGIKLWSGRRAGALLPGAGVEVRAAMSASVAMDMAVVMRCAMTQPTIFSREVRAALEDVGRRRRYILHCLRTVGDSGGEERARLIVSRSVESYEGQRQ